MIQKQVLQQYLLYCHDLTDNNDSQQNMKKNNDTYDTVIISNSFNSLLLYFIMVHLNFSTLFCVADMFQSFLFSGKHCNFA